VGKTEHTLITARLVLNDLETRSGTDAARRQELAAVRRNLDALASDLRAGTRHRATVLKIAREARMELERIEEALGPQK
jgi:hypothetical protein